MSEHHISTSRRILEVLKQSGCGMSTRELCEHLNLSSMAVRRQLTLLERDDLIFSRQEKKKQRGRPVNQYHLSTQGHESFERDYANLAIELLVSLRTLDGTEKVHQVFQQRKQEQLERYRNRILGQTLESRVHQVSQVMGEAGFMATWERLGPDKYLIRLMNCAVAHVARKFPHACIYEEEFLSELLRAKVTREHHILQKDTFCSYLVEPA